VTRRQVFVNTKNIERIYMKMSVDSNSEVLDTFNPISVSVKDTCNQAVSETMEVPASHILKDNKPNEWVQLLLPIFITLFVVFVEKWVTRWYSHSDEKEANARGTGQWHQLKLRV